MRRIITITCILLINALAAAQNVTFSFADTPLPEALRSIDQSQNEKHIYFFYDELETFRVTKDIKNLTALSAVKSVCKNLPVKIKSRDNDIFVNAKKEDQKPVGHLVMSGRVYDFKTRKDVVGATVQLLTTDSTVIAQEVAENKCMEGEKTWYQSDFYLIAPRVENTNYILKLTMVGYRTLYQDVHVGSLPKSLTRMELPMLLMREESRLLDEVTVSATKVKFYHRGDTVVYNADAFVMAEGSMLEVLVRQMPGVEIKPNGDIYHNGRLVQELLLNGKELFSKDRRVMLENLPTYMVKQIEIYERQTDKAKFLGDDSPGGKLYAMDVRLKKEYSIGWIANIEAGGGLANKGYNGDEPYLGRLFALRFTDHSRLAFYANANNLNDNRKPGEDDSWKPSDMKEGIQTEQLAGIDYNIDSRSKVWKLRGEAQFSHSVLDNESKTLRTNFLPTRNTQERISDMDRNKNLTLRTNHNLTITKSHVMFIVQPSLNYHKFDFTSATESETWNDTLINKYSRAGLNKGYDWNAGLTAYSTIKFDNTSNYVELKAGANYRNRIADQFNRYTLRYGQAQAFGRQSDQYYKNHPDNSFMFDASAIYSLHLSKCFNLSLAYSVKRSQTERHSSLYLLDQMDGYEQGRLGILPSVAEYLSTFDFGNSYQSRNNETSHTILPNLSYHCTTGKGRWYGEFRPNIILQHRGLDYRRGAIDTTLTRTNLQLGIFNSFLTWQSQNRRKMYGLWFTLAPQSPDLLNMVNMRDDTDPLNIRLGNQDLKASYKWDLRYVMRFATKVNQGVELNYSQTSDAISMGCIIDPKTGVRISRACNVNGNWNASTAYMIGRRIKSWSFDNGIGFRHQQNVDLQGTDASLAPQRSKVLTETSLTSLDFPAPSQGRPSVSKPKPNIATCIAPVPTSPASTSGTSNTVLLASSPCRGNCSFPLT